LALKLQRVKIFYNLPLLPKYGKRYGLRSGDLEDGDLLLGKSFDLQQGNLFITNEPS
jgi:hypothetical protein